MTSDSSSSRAPAPLRNFLELYGQGRFWDSHEALEDAWRANGSDFYQGLILYASAWVHWERGNAHGVQAQLGKALERLADYPDAYLGVDVAAVREHCGQVRAEVGREVERWQVRVAPAPLQFAGERVRGDEPELQG